MKQRLLLPSIFVLALFGVSAQSKPFLVVDVFTTADGVTLPYDAKQLRDQLVAELNVMVGKEFQVVPEVPATPSGALYTLSGKVMSWRAGNAAKRMFVGMGSGRESLELQYQVTDGDGGKPVDRKDTIRTNFYSQAGSTGTLGHPIAQKIAERIKAAKLR